MLTNLIEKTNARINETGYAVAGCAGTIAGLLSDEQAARVLNETGNSRYMKKAAALIAPEFDTTGMYRSRAACRADVNHVIVSLISAEINGWNE